MPFPLSQIGYVEDADRGEDDGGSGSAVSSAQAVPLSPLTVPYGELYTQSLAQHAVLQSSAASLLDSCERLLGVVSQLRLNRLLHDRARYGEEGKSRAEQVSQQMSTCARQRRRLAEEVRQSIEQLEQHQLSSLQHRHDRPDTS